MMGDQDFRRAWIELGRGGLSREVTVRRVPTIRQHVEPVAGMIHLEKGIALLDGWNGVRFKASNHVACACARARVLVLVLILVPV